MISSVRCGLMNRLGIRPLDSITSLHVYCWCLPHSDNFCLFECLTAQIKTISVCLNIWHHKLRHFLSVGMSDITTTNLDRFFCLFECLTSQIQTVFWLFECPTSQIQTLFWLFECLMSQIQTVFWLFELWRHKFRQFSDCLNYDVTNSDSFLTVWMSDVMDSSFLKKTFTAAIRIRVFPWQLRVSACRVWASSKISDLRVEGPRPATRACGKTSSWW